MASKRFLIENMPLLAKEKVKTLYLEHVLTDFHQADLDLFNRTGKMPQNLERYLKQLDAGHGTDPTGQYTFMQVIKSAQENHLRVQAIDCLASYHSNGILGAQANFRQKMMNYFAHTVMEADQAARGAHKWVALVGDSHANTYEGVAGLSELEGTLGLRLEDSELGQARGIEPDPGRTALQMGRAPTSVKNDLRLQLEMPADVRVANQLEQRLPLPGMYMRHAEPGGMLIVSRDRNDLIKITPLKRDGAGYFVERPEWTTLHGRRFNTVEELNQALSARNMTEVLQTNRLASPVASTSAAAARQVPTTYAANLLLEGQTLNRQPGRLFNTYSLQASGDLPSHAILMGEHAYYIRWEQDINGPGHWAIVDPVNPNAFNRSIPVRLNSGGEWEAIAAGGLKGGTGGAVPGPSSASGPQPFSAYDVPTEAFEETHIQFVRDADGRAHAVSSGQRLINQSRQRLLDDAVAFFKAPGHCRPARACRHLPPA
ncbi:membrane-targeted effector domain-containing toxin [Pseudomonas poae]|nr:membrane-targeted effector domain-containing toxin [Pseudomonas poae]